MAIRDISRDSFRKGAGARVNFVRKEEFCLRSRAQRD